MSQFWGWSLNRNFMVSLNTKILTEGKSWLTSFTKKCLEIPPLYEMEAQGETLSISRN